MDKRTFDRLDRTFTIILIAAVVVIAAVYGVVKFLAFWRIAFG